MRAEEGGGGGLIEEIKGKGWIREHRVLCRVGGFFEECYQLHQLFPVLTPYSEMDNRGAQFCFSAF